MTVAETSAAEQDLLAARMRAARVRRFGLFFIALTVTAGAALAYWSASRGTETTDDAYVAGDVVQVSSLVNGTVDAVMVENAQWVHAGEPLFRIDSADARLALDAAVAELAHAVRAYRTARADVSREDAQVLLQRSALAKASDDLRRRESLAQDGGVSSEDIRHAHDAMTSAAASLSAQQAAYEAALAKTDSTSIESNPLVRAAAARVRSAALALRRGETRAPIGGLVTHRVVQVGQHVAPGTIAMALVPLDRVWVEANFKESQLREMHPGETVELRSDLYGPDVVFHGRIDGIEAGTGAAFASVPAQNATGNWIKVVQRVPVRIALDPSELRAHPLRIGLSMTASVPLGYPAGTASAATLPALAGASAAIDETNVYRRDEDAGEALVAETIRANSGSAGAHKPGA
ncbi:efflux RND transporter periplasmic adaptor subunit [Trinickia diaoshuihuensis]|uniref:HlyD family secretion protein n=1 Tax=Trinickia diaoshuihuensis TaxID=2292265 RepID=UPI000E27DBC3|nr:efflux RND transporter periplasmic adaptor subunit [Trinickia diaoshuihuensis]